MSALLLFQGFLARARAIPYGFRLDQDGNHLVPDPHEQRAMATARELAAGGTYDVAFGAATGSVASAITALAEKASPDKFLLAVLTGAVVGAGLGLGNYFAGAAVESALGG